MGFPTTESEQVNKNTQFPLIKSHKVMHRLALFVALAFWCSAATAQMMKSYTGWPLAGAHATQPCAACHKNNAFKGTPSDCYTCHKTDYNNAKSPVDHIASKYPTTCDSCHKFSDATWMQATFSHTSFPLLGVHTTTPCTTCHNPPYAPSANNTTAVPTTCYGCHVRDFTGATSPVPHTGFSTTCDSCHRNSDATWSQKSAFLHNTYFALAGAHVTAPCSQCHNPPYAPSPNNYLNVPTTPCAACHLRDYNNATTPVNHIAAGFPTTCDTCHKFSDATWSLGTFNHTWFPITSGRHANNACSACHVDRTNFKVFSCLGCHSQSSTVSHHTGVAGFRYDSNACYSCHPTGRAG